MCLPIIIIIIIIIIICNFKKVVVLEGDVMYIGHSVFYILLQSTDFIRLYKLTL
jgi:hypothetical protein